MTAKLGLRSYQRQAVDAVTAAWGRGMMRPAGVAATGTGKTVVFSHLIDEWRVRNPGRRALVLAHRTELIDQAAGKLHSVAPDMHIGVVKGTRNQTMAQVIVASVQTLGGASDSAERRRRMLRDVGLVVVDEAHHGVAATYRRILEHYGCFADGAVALGVTATMSRGDKLALGDVWQDVVFAYDTGQAMRDGYLVRPIGVRVRVDNLDLRKVRRTAGDYADSALGEAIEQSLAPEAIAKAYAEHARDRLGILFAPTVHSAQVIGEALRDAGFRVGHVNGAMPAAERARVLDDLREGRVQIVTNCAVLTEGTDLPMVSCVVIARPTTSSGLYIQMVGRCLRLHPGKRDALVLDVVGATRAHALAARIELFGEDVAESIESDDIEGEDVTDEILASDDLGEPAGPGFPGEGDFADGPLVSEVVDLFSGSTSAWLRTYAGVWFLPAGERLVAILPAPRTGAYDVISMHRYHRGTGRWIVRDVDDLAYAMAWAEGDVSPGEKTTAARERPWRAKRPSAAQLYAARRHGLALSDDMLSGEVSNLITVAEASVRIDSGLPPYVPRG